MALRKWITKDVGWKLFSLALAILIWITIRKGHEEPESLVQFATLSTQTFTNLPLSVLSASGGTARARLAPAGVNVTVSGPRDIVLGLQENQIHATVNLTGIDAATDLKHVVDVALPPGKGLTLVSVVPPDVTVSLPMEEAATNEMQMP